MKKYDIILIHYNLDPVGYLIRLFTKSKWNHCAFILDSNYIIESNRKGIMISNINKFNNPLLYKTKYLKIKNLSKSDKKEMIWSMLSQSNHKLWHIQRFYAYFLILCHYRGHISTKTCSSLLAYAFAYIGRYFCLKDLDLTTPEDINTSNEVIHDY